jgi:hypothetical protein
MAKWEILASITNPRREYSVGSNLLEMIRLLDTSWLTI